MIIGPDDVRDRLTRLANKDLGPQSEKDKIIDAILRNVSPNYFRMRKALVVAGFALPVVLFLVATFKLDFSISTYYHFGDITRNILVGVLWAVGAFLFLYQGCSRIEDILLNVAGVAAVVTSLYPTGNQSWHRPVPPVPQGIADVHFWASTVFFICLAVVCIFLSGKSVPLIANEQERRRFRTRYYVFGAAMLIIPSVIAFGAMMEWGNNNRIPFVWALEVAVIYVFALYWLTKSGEFTIIAAQLQLPAPKPPKRL